ncbi:MAG: HAMP domain-containing histidine kinase [Burkholderiaceae bacterium]|nr:MAG: HAMP domain-containing histidine kinase [Burkholderiaceae bacterium]
MASKKTPGSAASLRHDGAAAVQAPTWLAPAAAPTTGKQPMEAATIYGRFARRTFTHQWEAFMSARIVLALAILGLHASADTATQALPGWAYSAAIAYTVLTLVELIFMRPPRPGQSFDSQWLYTTGIDLLYFCVLRSRSVAGVDYTPFLVFPVFMAAILSSRTLALSTAVLAGAAQFYAAIIESQGALWSHATQLGQAAFVGVGLVALAWATNFLAARVIREEVRSERSRADSKTQALVNRLVMETLGDGILVANAEGEVHAANPSARALLAGDAALVTNIFNLGDKPDWAPLATLVHRTFESGPIQPAETALLQRSSYTAHVRVRTERAVAPDDDSTGLCVLFLQDQRELEARIRTEKLASMGRVSSAVAHEFRNPLAAIQQANELLSEALAAPADRRLSTIIQQNVERLKHTVEDILDVARVQTRAVDSAILDLDAATQAVCDEWIQLHGQAGRVRVLLGATALEVQFKSESLRRLLINLLDNAARYASRQSDAIMVTTHADPSGTVVLSVWSDGAPLDASLQRHLFEPFFSSESRSSGLGLFICRQLCEQYDASINHQSTTRRRNGVVASGNEFLIHFLRAAPGAQPNAQSTQA